MRLVYRIKVQNNFDFRKYLNEILLLIFLFNTIFIPVDTFNLKIISLILLLIINVDCYFKLRTRGEYFSVLFGFVLTTYNILASILFTGDIYLNISMGYMGYILLLYPLILKYNIPFVKYMMNILLCMAYFIVLMALLDILGIVSVYSNPILMWLYYTDNAMIGKGAHLVLGICLFLKTSPMLLLAIPQMLKNEKYAHAIIVVIALIFSGTRANIFVSIVVFLYCYIFLKRNSIRTTILICIFGFIGMFILLDGSLIETISEMFVLKASSDAIRDSDLNAILEIWRNNPISFIVGTGFSSQFFSIGHNIMTNTIELSYWNLLRQVGIISFILMMNMYLKPIKLLSRSNKMIVVAYIGYLIIAYTNPLLYSSTGMAVLLFMYFLAYD